jgi:NAD-specific glutamate dehydrogenase
MRRGRAKRESVWLAVDEELREREKRGRGKNKREMYALMGKSK